MGDGKIGFAFSGYQIFRFVLRVGGKDPEEEIPKDDVTQWNFKIMNENLMVDLCFLHKCIHIQARTHARLC